MNLQSIGGRTLYLILRICEDGEFAFIDPRGEDVSGAAPFVWGRGCKRSRAGHWRCPLTLVLPHPVPSTPGALAAASTRGDAGSTLQRADFPSMDMDCAFQSQVLDEKDGPE